jgi:hypothetical protein
MSDQPVPDQSIPDQSIPGQSIPGQSVQDQPDSAGSDVHQHGAGENGAGENGADTIGSDRARTDRPYTVVVGVSSTSKSPAALAWADAQASANHGRVVAVRAWRMPNPQATPSGTAPGRIYRQADVEAEARRSLEEDVNKTLGEGNAAEIRLVHGGKFAVLVEAAGDADLLVVDAPRQLLAGPMFAHRLLYAAACPVVVMPPQISGEPASTLARVAGAIGRGVLTAAGTAGRPGYRRPLNS